MDGHKTCACAFCDNTYNVNSLFFGLKSSSVICAECIEKAHILSDCHTEQMSHEDGQALPLERVHETPRSVVDHLDRFVIGQKDAKRALAISMYKHIERARAVIAGKSDDSFPSSNVILIGDSGVGKTLLAEQMCKLANIPFTIVDCTNLTQAGYSGDDVSTCINQLIVKADGDIKKAQYGIVFLDEVDKIVAKGSSKSLDVSGQAVQQSLLKMIEGKEILIDERNPINKSNESFLFDTKNILFIAGGSFAELRKARELDSQRGIGFIATGNNQTNTSINLSDDDLISGGLIPEFIGRFPIKTHLSPLTKKDMVDIMKHSESGFVKTYCKAIENKGVSIKIDDLVFEKIADIASKRKVGARAIQGVFQPIIDNILYDTDGLKGLSSIHIFVSGNDIMWSLEKKRDIIAGDNEQTDATL